MLAPGKPIQKQQNHESNKYFAPISPAANTNSGNIGILDMLQRGGGNPNQQSMMDKAHHAQQQIDNRNLMFLLDQQKSSGMDSPNLNQMPSVEELEARLRGHPQSEPSPNSNVPRIITNNANSAVQPIGMPPQTIPGPVQDVNAFKRMLAQMSDVSQISGVLPTLNPSLQQLQQQANLISMLSGKPGANQNPNTEELKKMFNFMQQVQAGGGPITTPTQQPQGRPIQGQKHLQQPEPLQNMMHLNQIPPQNHLQPDLRNSEILKRPEAQVLIQSIIRGEIKPGFLWQQVASPGITPKQRETITAVLNTLNASPRVSSPNLLIPPGGAPIPPLVQNGGLAAADLQTQLILQQQKQQLRLSPLPNGKFSFYLHCVQKLR